MSIECNCKSVMTISELKGILSKYEDADKITIWAGTTQGFGYGEVNIVKDNGEHGELVMCYQE